MENGLSVGLEVDHKDLLFMLEINKMTQSFDEYCKSNQHSGNCTRLEAFSMGQKSRQAEIDELQKRIDRAMKYTSESPLKDVSRKAMINFLDILKGNKYE